MTNMQQLISGNCFGQEFFIVAYNGELQLYWEDGEYSVTEINPYECVARQAQKWADELYAEEKRRNPEDENAAIRASTRWAEYCNHEEI